MNINININIRDAMAPAFLLISQGIEVDIINTTSGSFSNQSAASIT